MKVRRGERRPCVGLWFLPNFYFHATTVYAILRHNGVELGKRDFIGEVTLQAHGVDR